ncbi:TetR family transcriptional regulator [Streptomyces sp. NPDC001833]|uniref:TetR/AcrR family transcriptional regulator n=1 Tax=Streptomyces sp. NPDC001833 TaxID=3154658 RepID=UPI003320B19E
MSRETRAAAPQSVHQPGTPELLLRQAERLYAEHGIAAVSNRRVAEAIGIANNYAVGYHFGTKAGLVRALVRSHYTEIDRIRRQLLLETAAPHDTHDLARLLVLPTVLHLAEQPAPTWYARFYLHAMTDPEWRALLTEEGRATPSTKDTWEALLDSITGVDRRILEFRGQLISVLVARACAGYEEQLDEGTQLPGTTWQSVGDFVVDAVTGMLTAPQTRRA